ncbi:1-phosphofructokinase [Alicyclobacillaceae bacterium I2511]|nr:1-phosphofructokinase [Alicyclobacillaceae bacterium I2511]
MTKEVMEMPQLNHPQVVTVTLNPAVDMFVYTNELTPGSLHRVKTPIQYPGGKGINVSKALMAFGTSTLAVCIAGGKQGRWLEESLQGLGMKTAFVQTEIETRMNLKIVESCGRLTEFNTQVPELGRVEDLETLQSILDRVLVPGDWVVLSGALPRTAPVDWYGRVVEHCKAHQIKTVLDTSGDALREGIQACPEVVKPNLVELEELVGRPLKSAEEVLTAAQQFIVQGVSTVLMSMGAEGLLVTSQEGMYRVQIPRVSVRSTVGAGDTTVAGFLHATFSGMNFSDSLRFAAAAGTASVVNFGNGAPSLLEVEKVFQQVLVTRMEVAV